MINWGFFKIRAVKTFSILGMMTMFIAVIGPDYNFIWTALLSVLLYLEAWSIGWQITEKEFAEYEEHLLTKYKPT